MTKTDPILQKIKHSLFIEEEMKQKIISQWNTLVDFQKERISKIIETLESTQTMLLAKAAQKNPDLLKELNTMLKKERNKNRKNKEEKDRSKDDTDANKLLKDLDSI